MESDQGESLRPLPCSPRPVELDGVLTPDLRRRLNAFCGEIDAAMPGRVVSIILYGEAIQPELVDTIPDWIDVLVVLDSIGLDLLDRMMKPVRVASRKIGLSPQILAASELHGSTDVFPIRYLLMQRHYVLLRGKDVLRDLTITRDHLRLRCEQELRILQQHMRWQYLRLGQRSGRLREVLQTELSGFLNCLSGALLLKYDSVPVTKGEVVALAAKAFEVEQQALVDLLRMRRGAYRPAGDDVRRLFEQFMGIVGQTVTQLDSLS